MKGLAHIRGKQSHTPVAGSDESVTIGASKVGGENLMVISSFTYLTPKFSIQENHRIMNLNKSEILETTTHIWICGHLSFRNPYVMVMHLPQWHLHSYLPWLHSKKGCSIQSLWSGKWSSLQSGGWNTSITLASNNNCGHLTLNISNSSRFQSP